MLSVWRLLASTYCARRALFSALLLACGPIACGEGLNHREALLTWQALIDARLVEPLLLDQLVGRTAYEMPVSCSYSGGGQSTTLHTYVADDVTPDSAGELTAYVRYELRACQPHKDAPELSGSLRRGLQHRRQKPTLDAEALEDSSYDHIFGVLTLRGAVTGSCVVDLHRTLSPGVRPHYEGVLCGLPAAHVAR